MQTTSKVKYIDRSLVVSPYSIALCQSEEAFNREIKRLKVTVGDRGLWIEEGKSGQVHKYASTDGSFHRVCIVCIRYRKGRKHSETVGLLIHEAVHVWQNIRELINEDKPSDEFEAYSIQAIAQGLIDAYVI